MKSSLSPELAAFIPASVDQCLQEIKELLNQRLELNTKFAEEA